MDRNWFDRVCQSALGHRTSQEMTYDIMRLCLEREIPGDIVEAGVYAGASIAIMAKAYMEYCLAYPNPQTLIRRRFHLFDSFAGIPPPEEQDIELALNVGGESACSLEDVKKNMRDWGIQEEILVYHPGLFRDTMPRAPIGNIAILRLDGDLYSSTKVCMEHLYPLLTPGGYVICDDFDLTGCRQAVLEWVVPSPAYWRKNPA